MTAGIPLWVRRARKLAAQSDIALPGPLADRVARFLRKEMLLSQLASGLSCLSTLTVLRAIGSNGNWAASLPLILTGLPLCFAAVC